MIQDDIAFRVDRSRSESKINEQCTSGVSIFCGEGL